MSKQTLQERLAARNGREKIANELLGRIRSRDSNTVVYSTQQAAERRLSSDEYRKKVGVESVVSQGYNPHDGSKGSNRKRFYTWGGETCSDQKISGRTMRK